MGSDGSILFFRKNIYLEYISYYIKYELAYNS